MYLILLPVCFLLLWMIVLNQLPKVPGQSVIRESLVRSTLIGGGYLTGITEVLGLLGLIKPSALLVSWLLTALGLLIYLLSNHLFSINTIISRVSNLKLSIGEYLLVGGTALLLIATCIIGIIVPPNNWDSMTYHMARVAHWIQNESVAHYPTHITRQHYQAPLTEYAILHLQLLSGGDYFANLVQWFAYAGCMIGVTLLIKMFGGSRKAQIMGMSLVATLPMAVLQSTSTQNDLAVSYWIVIAVLFLYRLRTDFSRFNVVLTGAATGLALFTKSTAYLFLFPFFVWFALDVLVRQRTPIGRLLKLVGITAGCILVVNGSQFLRNYQIYDHPLGGTAAERASYTNALHTPQALASNLIRNAAVHLRSPVFYWNRAVFIAVRQVHKWLGLDMYDFRTTFYSSGNLILFGNWKDANEDTMGNLLFFLLGTGFIPYYFLVVRKQAHYPGLTTHLLLVITVFVFFCGYLRWQEWVSRLHTPLFILLVPFCAIVLRKAPAWFSTVVLVTVWAGAAQVVAFNERKPLLTEKDRIWGKTRLERYQGQPPALNTALHQASAYTVRKHHKRIGLIMGEDDGDYLYWVFLKRRLGNSVLIRHVNVTNPSGSVRPQQDFTPDCIIAENVTASIIKVNHTVFYRRKVFAFISLYEPK